MVTGATRTGVLALGDDSELSGDITHRYLFGVLLDFDLLVFDKFGPSGLEA